MLYLLFGQLALIFILFGWGKLFSTIFGDFWTGLSNKLTIGIVAVTAIASIFGFFFSLSLYFEIFVISIGILGCAKNIKEIISYFYQLKSFWFIAFLTFGILICTFAPFINDHFGYYVNTISWLNEYGIIKGIANINLVLGQQSSWHIFQASFDEILDPFLRINLIIYIIYVLYFFEKKQWYLALFLPFFLIYLQSPSPDLIIYCLSIIIVNEVFTNANKLNYKALWLLSIFLFTIKPIVFWLPLFLSILWIKSNYKELFHVKNIIVTLLLLIPFFIKQIWCFGDILFPINTNLFTFSWQPSPFLLQLSNKYALLKTYDFQFTETEIQSWNTTTKIIEWLTLSGFKKIVNCAIVILIFLFGSIAFIKKNQKMVLLWICVTLKVIIIFYLSGQYRFMIDAVLPLIALMLIPLNSKQNFIKTSSLLGILAVLFVFLFPKFLQQNVKSFYIGHLMGKPEITQIIEPMRYSISDYSKYKISNFEFYTPNNYHLMLDVPITCLTPYSLHEFSVAGVFPVAYDEKDLSKGFYHKKLTAQQKQKLDGIIKKYTIYNPIE